MINYIVVNIFYILKALTKLLLFQMTDTIIDEMNDTINTIAHDYLNPNNSYIESMLDRSDENITEPTNMTVGDLYTLSHPQVTFLKNVYCRHTQFTTKNIIYNFINNKVILPKIINITENSVKTIEIITKVWIDNISNVKSFGVYIVGANVDVDMANFNRTNQTGQQNLSDQVNESILQIHKVDMVNILLYDSIIKRNQYVSDWTNVPCGNLCMIPSMLDNQRILFIIEKYDDNIENNLQIKYYISDSNQEISLFSSALNHEYLLKKYISFDHHITPGENIINFDISNESITYMFVAIPTTKNNTIADQTNIQIQYYTVTDVKPIGPTEPIELNNNMTNISPRIVMRTINLVKTTSNPELSWLKLDDYDIYMLDACANVTTNINAQLCGVISVRNNSRIIINTNLNTNISIGYSYLDVLRYVGGYVGLSRRRLRIVNGEGPNQINPIESETESMGFGFYAGRRQPYPSTIDMFGNNEEVADENGREINNNIDQFEEIGWDRPTEFNNNNNDNNVDNIDNVSNVGDISHYADITTEINMIEKSHYLLSEMIISYAKKTAKVKILPLEKSMCQISLEQINYGDYYYKCYKCKNVFSMDSFNKWINKTNLSSTCPTCRNPIYEQPLLFVNGHSWIKIFYDTNILIRDKINNIQNSCYKNINTVRGYLLFNILSHNLVNLKISQC